MIRFFGLIGLLVWMSTSTVQAQSARLFGTVKEKGGNEFLPGANVIIKGTNYGAAVNIEGNYIIQAIPAGTYTVVVTYIGFNDVEQEITLAAGERKEMNFELSWQGIEGDEVLVTAQARGQIDAINQQRASNTIANIVSKDRIQELPDVNAAESVGRLPGISIQRSGGEANKIVIRGLSPKFNNVTVNGVRIPATGSTDRSVDMSLISSNMLDGIEVSKALTPDKDGDALGGTVDLKIRNAAPGFHSDVMLQGGYTALQNVYSNYKLVGSVSNRFFKDKLGVIVNFNTEKYDRSADRFNAGYVGQLNPRNNNEREPKITSVLLDENGITRGRNGASLVIDYELPYGKLIGNSFYNELTDDGIRRTNYFDYSGKQHNYTMSQSKNTTDIFTYSIGIEQNYNWLEWDASYAQSNSNSRSPRDLSWQFVEQSPIVTANDTLDFPSIDQMISVYRNNIDNTFVDNLSIYNRTTEEEQKTLQLNVKVPFTITSEINGYVKVGAKYRQLDRTNDENNLNRGWGYGADADLRRLIATEMPELGIPLTDVNGNPVAVPRILMEPFLSDYSRSNFLNNEYDLGYTARLDYLRKLTGIVTPFLFPSQNASLGNDYVGLEKYKAYYAMTEINLTKYVSIMPGFRYEGEETKYDAKFVREVQLQNPDSPLSFRDTTGSRSQEFFLPMVHLKINPTEWLNIRLAYTESITRGDFTQYSPNTFIDRFGAYVNAPNTNLRSSLSRNYDASVSVYNGYVGFLTVSGFYKNIKDLIWFAQFPLVPGQTIIPDLVLPGVTGSPVINTYVNNSFPAYVQGIEFDWQTSFWYLPNVFKGLVLNINYTMISSETTFQRFKVENVAISPRPPRPPFFEKVLVDTTRKGRLFDQPSNILNATVGYDYKGFSTRLSFYYQTDILRSLSNLNPNEDGFTDNYYRIDFSVKQKINETIQVFGNFNNLNNRPDRNFQSKEFEVPSFIEYYGFTMDLGVRFVW